MTEELIVPEKLVLRAELVNGRYVVIDQDDREVRGVTKLDLSAGLLDGVAEITITFFAAMPDGSLAR